MTIPMFILATESFIFASLLNIYNVYSNVLVFQKWEPLV